MKFSKKTIRTAGRKIYKATGLSNPIKKGKVSSTRIIKDIQRLKSLVNAEKEIYAALSITSQTVDVSTPYFAPITNTTEGTGHGQRDGESIKLHGFRWNSRFSQQTSVTNPIYVKMWLVKYIGPRGSTPAVSTFLKPDWDNQYSAMSERNEDHYKSYRVIASSFKKIPVDNVSGQIQFVLDKRYGRFKGDSHQRYSGISGTSLLTDQMYVLIVTSGGNTATSTAVNVDSQLLLSFYDN